MRTNTALLLMAIASFLIMLGVLYKANKQNHDIVYGAVKVRGEVFKCEKWNSYKNLPRGKR